MPRSDQEYPHRDEVIDYLRRYEERYSFNIQRPVQVADVVPVQGGFQLKSACGQCWYARTVVLATGTWRNPYIPPIPGRDAFSGQQLHSAFYKCPEAFTDQHVLVVGGANSGAQILAEVSHTAASTTWVTLEPPRFLPDDVDGRVLFDRATARWRALQEGRTPQQPSNGLGDIVMVPSVRAARERGVLQSRGPLAQLTATTAVWPDGSAQDIDAIIWCTGFRPALQPLTSMGLVQEDGKIQVQGTQATAAPGLWLVGYGEWTGMASATLVGVMRTARSTAQEIDAYLADFI